MPYGRINEVKYKAPAQPGERRQNWRPVIYGDNNKILFTGEAYYNKADAESALAAVYIAIPPEDDEHNEPPETDVQDDESHPEGWDSVGPTF
jgi:uncharacterized protein YegP (UPF0339 family)